MSATERVGNIKATRQDWIDAALTSIETAGIEQLKILTLAEELTVSRSSFYWYFEDMGELHDELLQRWAQSTDAIIERTLRPAAGITRACLGVFECWADATLYNPLLDFAVRDWGRSDAAIAERVYRADIDRLTALADMFCRYEFTEADAMVRARLLYHSQLGYYAARTNEPVEMRLMFLPSYLLALTGREPSAAELDEFTDYFREVQITNDSPPDAGTPSSSR